MLQLESLPDDGNINEADVSFIELILDLVYDYSIGRITKKELRLAILVAAHATNNVDNVAYALHFI